MAYKAKPVGITTYVASQIEGVILDCDITTGAKIGGGTATDNTTALNAVLALATATNPIKLIIDGGSSNGGLRIPAGGHVTIEGLGWDTGFFIKSGANSSAISNTTPNFDQQTTAPARGGNVIFSNFMVNGNRGTYPNGNSSLASNGTIDAPSGNSISRERGGLGGYTLGTLVNTINASATTIVLSQQLPSNITAPATIVIGGEILNVTAIAGDRITLTVTRAATVSGWTGGSAAASHSAGVAVGSFYWYCGIDMANLDGITLDNVKVYDSPTYNYRLNNCGSIDVKGCKTEFSSTTNQAPNTDGFHIDGPCNDLHIDGLTCTFTGDDAISLNLDEGYGGIGTRISINNVTYDRCAVGMRIYGQVDAVKELVVSNVSGSLRDKFLILGNYGSASAGVTDIISSASFSNITVTPQSSGMTQLIELATGVGTLSLANVDWVAPASGATAWITCSAARAGSVVSDLRIVNCRNYQNSTAKGIPALIILNATNGGTAVAYGTVTIDGFANICQKGQSGVAIAKLIDETGGGTIDRLVINALDPTNITALATAYTGITLITGPGVVATGFQIPDANMDNNSIYLSATGGNAGIPCVKLGGTVNPWYNATIGIPHARNAVSTTTGSGALITNSNSASIKAPAGSYSIVALYKSFGTNAGQQNIMGHAGTFSGGTNYNLGLTVGGNFQFLTKDTGGNIMGTEVSAGTTTNWHCVGGVHDESGGGNFLEKVYIDGTLGLSQAANGLHTAQNTVRFQIGSTADPFPTNGVIAMVFKVTGILSLSDMAWIANVVGGVPLGRSLTELQARVFSGVNSGTPNSFDYLYTFDNTGALGTDSSSNANTLSATGSPALVSAAGPG